MTLGNPLDVYKTSVLCYTKCQRYRGIDPPTIFSKDRLTPVIIPQDLPEGIDSFEDYMFILT